MYENIVVDKKYKETSHGQLWTDSFLLTAKVSQNES